MTQILAKLWENRMRLGVGGRPRRCALGSPPPRCFLLLRGEFRRSAHMQAAHLRPVAAFGGADQVALHVRQPAENGNQQAPGAGGSVGPWLSQWPELRLGVHDQLADGEEVKGGSSQPVGSRARHLLAVNLGAAPSRSWSSCASMVFP
jgi:hypothetical protein